MPLAGGPLLVPPPSPLLARLCLWCRVWLFIIHMQSPLHRTLCGLKAFCPRPALLFSPPLPPLVLPLSLALFVGICCASFDVRRPLQMHLKVFLFVPLKADSDWDSHFNFKFYVRIRLIPWNMQLHSAFSCHMPLATLATNWLAVANVCCLLLGAFSLD